MTRGEEFDSRSTTVVKVGAFDSCLIARSAFCVLGVLVETRVLSLVAELSDSVGGLHCKLPTPYMLIVFGAFVFSACALSLVTHLKWCVVSGITRRETPPGTHGSPLYHRGTPATCIASPRGLVPVVGNAVK